ncbi:MAG: transcription antitermination factor NusB [Actinomycetia bacterium]|nr:transcription antitermination factor NusB [Actinomycetes bacterium]
MPAKGEPAERRSARRKARKRAVDILYESDLRGTDVLATAADRLKQSDPPVPEYAVDLVEGVTAHRERIDELLTTYAEGWTLDRMPAVDRNILRVAIYELLWNDDVPDPVAIDEAVDLAKDLSTDESPRFVNGLLGRIQLLKENLS